MLQNYLKIALRNLRINRTYTILNVAGLSMGMTGAILIFLFLQNHLSTDRHQPGFDRLYRLVLNLHLDEGIEYSSDTSVPLAGALAMDYSQIEKVGFIKKIPVATLLSIYQNETRRFTEKENVVFADQGFMEIFKFNVLEGNLNGIMKEPYAAVISEKVARKYFGLTNVVGKILRLDNATDLRIAGVLKESQNPTDLKFDVYISLPTIKKIEPAYDLDNFGWLSSRNQIFIRLVPGADFKSVEKLIKTNGTKYYAETARYYEHKLQPLSEVHFDERYGGKIRRPILIILVVVGLFLLFIACINFINLATAQAIKRAKEIGVRKVLGSTRRQLFWQFMSETALLTLFSAFVTLLLVALLLPVLNNWTQTQDFYFGMVFQLQFLFCWSLTILSVIPIAGFYPAVIISGFNPITALKGKLGTKQIGGLGLRRSLIVAQLLIAQILVIGTLVLILQLKYFKNADLGFDQNAVLTVQLPNKNSKQKINGSLRNSLLQFADIKSVAYQYEAPTSSMGFGGQVKFDKSADWEKFVIRERYGDENYISTYKMKLIAGRSFTDRDSLKEFVVNEELMFKLGITDPQKVLGKMLNTGMGDLKGRIVGVVKSFHLKSLQVAVEPCVIFAKPAQYKEIAIKLNTKDFGKTIRNIQAVWQKDYPDDVFSYQFVDEQIAKFYEKEEQLTTLIRSFALIAILICCLGLYGMVSFMVTQRTKEIGVRKVLGAGVESIVLLFGKEFLILVLVAFLIAAPVGCYFASHWLTNFAYRIDLKWWIPASGCLIILVITLLTIGFKVIKASLMNPVKSLRME
ncbi:ABC transporter permease [Dyadobacter psychrotolerans]|uniref:ABC transporter permease n=1 Tax=Dyadobacter psychrotolerans TaxID=2541721 RepID=A0A4R5E2S1_9BACT|nr:ABC transporter permease [Dyadobacter psychrotolerans]TDE18513.1 ABC transporter permease [Dyadobacter psychrotolerans]